jgi:hypothetical protein
MMETVKVYLQRLVGKGEEGGAEGSRKDPDDKWQHAARERNKNPMYKWVTDGGCPPSHPEHAVLELIVVFVESKVVQAAN